MRLFESGTEVDSTFSVATSIIGGPTVTFHARAGSGKTRNAEYSRGLRLLVERLRILGDVRGCVLASKNAMYMKADERQLTTEADADLSVEDYCALLMRRAAKAGRRPGAKGSGNSTKRVRFHMSWKLRFSVEEIERALSQFLGAEALRDKGEK